MNKRLLLALALLVGCASHPTKLENIPLVWKPEKHPNASAGAASSDLFKVKIKVAPMTDSRKDAALIGENREKQPVRTVTTSDNVAQFVTNQFKALLSTAGMTVVDSGESVVIKGDVQQFFVTETEDYVGDVRLGITVTDASGKSLWQGTTAGSSNRMGSSYRADNYYESLSDALSVATSNLLQNQGFQAAVTHK
ncbi:MAG TPA: YajG family lipoprotein [Burkholderiales bacterium]|nr:YajG family lipoprotein [Burkholderiales bacterium]